MLKEIQSLEDQLIYSSNCGSSSLLFTVMMHRTSEWIESNKPKETFHISPFKLELDKLVDNIAYYIECGEITEKAVTLAGGCFNTIKPKLTDTHKHILQAARKQRKINKLKNK
tara:strand:+ start:745 stop:1083 length:339 start_codon:yes stop_codon:yes gene_type:complete